MSRSPEQRPESALLQQTKKIDALMVAYEKKVTQSLDTDSKGNLSLFEKITALLKSNSKKTLSEEERRERTRLLASELLAAEQALAEAEAALEYEEQSLAVVQERSWEAVEKQLETASEESVKEYYRLCAELINNNRWLPAGELLNGTLTQPPETFLFIRNVAHTNFYYRNRGEKPEKEEVLYRQVKFLPKALRGRIKGLLESHKSIERPTKTVTEKQDEDLNHYSDMGVLTEARAKLENVWCTEKYSYSIEDKVENSLIAELKKIDTPNPAYFSDCAKILTANTYSRSKEQSWLSQDEWLGYFIINKKKDVAQWQQIDHQPAGTSIIARVKEGRFYGLQFIPSTHKSSLEKVLTLSADEAKTMGLNLWGLKTDCSYQVFDTLEELNKQVTFGHSDGVGV